MKKALLVVLALLGAGCYLEEERTQDEIYDCLDGLVVESLLYYGDRVYYDMVYRDDVYFLIERCYR